jgi:predicted SprT family Zn-dependent metalloprotease
VELEKASELLNQEMAKHGLYQQGWRTRWDNAKRRCGSCCFNRKVISLSRPYVRLNNAEEILDTIRHEIAHALVGFEHAHDSVWLAKAREIGTKGTRCKTSNVSVSPGRYTGTCLGCGITVQRYKRLPLTTLQGLSKFGHLKCPKTLSEKPEISWKENS